MADVERDSPSVSFGLLSNISCPHDIRQLDQAQLAQLASEIRDFLVTKISRTGGHLGPNLGVVELTLALHRVFDSPKDRILWDTGHQAYVHKILTGRQGGFDSLRRRGGLSGYPNQAESEHDIIENSHASTALSYADGLAKAYEHRKEHRHVVAVVGDGALTGGMCWEALNNIAAAPHRPVIIVVNDNGRSYAPTIGGLADRLTSLRLRPGYERALGAVRDGLSRTPLVGQPLYEALHGVKRGLKDVLAPQGLFEDLGLKYVGPIDGHDTDAVESALGHAKDFGGPVIVHCVTRKGFGYHPAQNDEADCLHGPGAFDPHTGRQNRSHGPSWTSVFSDELVRIAARRPDIVAITAAMLRPTGLSAFAEAYPDRVYDVGIAEQHAVTSAAGLALGGMHPVVAVYSTFVNRAFDQVLLDVGLHRLGVTFVLDRAGVTGEDGPSHNGVWDLSVLGVVPGIRIAAPRDEPTLRTQLADALACQDGPTVVRFPKGLLGPEIPALRRIGTLDVLTETEPHPDVLLVSIGAMAGLALDVSDRLFAQGISTRVVDPCWVTPVSQQLCDLAAEHQRVVTIEENSRFGGVGSRIALALQDHDIDIPIRHIGVPPEFLDHGSVVDVRGVIGLDAQSISRQLAGWAARRSNFVDDSLSQR